MSKLIQALSTLQKGSFLSVVIDRPVKTLKAFNHLSVTKRTIVTVTSGIDYDKQKAVIAKRASDELPETNRGLPWGEWVKYPYLIEHKNQSYVRLYIKGVPKVVWSIDGKQVTQAQAIEVCGSNAKSSDGKPDCITVKLENVVSATQGGKELV